MSSATTPRHSPFSMIRSMREVLDEELGLVLERLLVQRVQHRVAGAVRRRAGALRDALAVVRGHAAERPLVDAAVSVRENGTP